MADYAPQQYHADNDPVDENGHKGRYILPSNPPRADGTPVAVRRNSASTRFITGRQPIRDFTLRFGDTSENDRAGYPGNLAGTPQRAMCVYEQDGSRVVPVGNRLFMSSLINLLPSPTGQTISERGRVPWWEVLMQWNEAPIASQGATRWRSPVASVGLATKGGVEHMTFEVRREPPNRGDQGIVAYSTSIPVRRQQHTTRVEFIDGKNGDGMFKVWVDSVLVANHEGQTGYVGYGNPYSAHGYYRAPNAEEQRTIRFEGFTEGLIA